MSVEGDTFSFDGSDVDEYLSGDDEYDENTVPKKIVLDPTVEEYKNRLKRRNELIGTIRKAYLRDVVTIKHIIQDVLSKPERAQVIQEYKDRIPSLDLTKILELFSPSECAFELKPCVECGGTAEIVHRESLEMEKLSKTLAETLKRDEELRITNATYAAHLEKVNSRMEDITSSHNEEKLYLYKEVRTLKSTIETLNKEISDLNQTQKTLRYDNKSLKATASEYTRVSNELIVATDEIRQLHNLNLSLVEEIRQKNDDKQSLEEILELKTNEIESLNSKIEEIKNDLSSTKTDLRETQKLLTSTQKKESSLKSTLDTAKENTIILQKARDALEAQLILQRREYNEKYEILENSVDEQTEQSRILQESVTDLKRQLQTAISRISTFEKEIVILNKVIEEATKEDIQSKNKISNLSIDLNSTKNDYESLQNSYKKVEKDLLFSQKENLELTDTLHETEIKMKKAEKIISEHTASASTHVPIVGQQEGRKYVVKDKKPKPAPAVKLDQGDENDKALKAEMALARNKQIALGLAAMSISNDDDDSNEFEDPVIEDVLKTLTALLGPMGGAMVRDAIKPVLKVYSKSLYSSMKAMWESLLVSKRTADFYHRLTNAFSCVLGAGGMKYTNRKIDHVMKAFAYSESVHTREWVSDYEIETDILMAMNGKSNSETGNVKYKSHIDYFSYDPEVRKTKLSIAADTIRKIAIFSDSTVSSMDEALPAIIEEWYDIKLAYLNLIESNELEKKELKENHASIVSNLNTELSDAGAAIGRLKQDITQLEIQLIQQNGQLIELRPIKVQLNEAREIIHKTSLAKNELVREIESFKALYDATIEDHHVKQRVLLEELEDRKAVLKMNIDLLEISTKRSHDLRVQLQSELEGNFEVKRDFEDFKERDRRRREETRDCEQQCDPDVRDMAIQTEFICPPTALRHSTNVPGSTSRQKVFPVVRIGTASAIDRGSGWTHEPFGNESFVSEFVTRAPPRREAFTSLTSSPSTAANGATDMGGGAGIGIGMGYGGGGYESGMAMSQMMEQKSSFMKTVGNNPLPYVSIPRTRAQTNNSQSRGSNDITSISITSQSIRTSDETSSHRTRDSNSKVKQSAADMNKKRNRTGKKGKDVTAVDAAKIKEWEQWDNESRMSSLQMSNFS
eukprot:gene1398-2690_t